MSENKLKHVQGLGSLKKGVDEDLVRQLSADKNEPAWMLEKRLQAYEIFKNKPMPGFGPDLSGLNLDEIIYYAKASDIKNAKTWEDVPPEIKETFDRLGIPEAERAALAGVGAQYESEIVYHNLKEEYKKQGIIYEDLTIALQEYPDLVKRFFGKCLDPKLHKFMALHYAVWSGGTFLYLPEGVSMDIPVQSYFRMNTPGLGQFEHTLIAVEDGAHAHYIEGCSAPKYDTSALHAGGVELFVGKKASLRYTSVENWSRDVYNLNTKRAIVEEKGSISWVTGNMGSAVSMVYPASILKGDHASSEHLGVTVAVREQIQDVGAKVIHIGKNTTSRIVSKAISKDGGQSNYRGLVQVSKKAENAKVSVQCDALLLDAESSSETFPHIQVDNDTTQSVHEASAGSISEENLFYLKSRGLSEDEAMAMIVNGFIQSVVKEIPLEYAVEMNKIIELEVGGRGWVG